METIKEFKIRLEEKIKNSDAVFLTPHLNADFDTIASCIGMALIVKKIGKVPHIIIDEELVTMEPGVKIIVDEIGKMPICKDGDTISIINSTKYKKMQGPNDLLIALDLNKKYLTSCRDYLSLFKDIVLIDHHKEDDNTIESECKFIDISASSVSELITELMIFYQIKYNKRIADYLLAGIYLDTNKFRRNTTAKTMKLIAKLMEKGADLNRVNDLFSEDFLSDRKVQDLVGKADFFTYTVALVVADSTDKFNREELAKVADYLLRFRADATFAVGYIDNDTISISARSKGQVSVGDIMREFNGGGNNYSAAGKITGEDIKEVGMKLERKIKPPFYTDKETEN